MEYRFHLSCLDYATVIHNALNVSLDSLEVHVPATLALQMIGESSKSREIPSAATVWAVVELLLVDGRVEVLVQGYEFVKGAVAEIVLVGFNSVVPCPLGGLVASIARPGEQLLGDDAMGITASDSPIELVTVKTCLRARATLQVVNKASSCSMRLVAERAPGGAVAVELTVQMLLDVSLDIRGKARRSRNTWLILFQF